MTRLDAAYNPARTGRAIRAQPPGARYMRSACSRGNQSGSDGARPQRERGMTIIWVARAVASGAALDATKTAVERPLTR